MGTEKSLYVVTGATRGLGEALAKSIASDPGKQLLTIGRAPQDATNLHADLGDSRSTRAACEELAQRVAAGTWAKAVLFNNAGAISPVGPLERLEPEELERNLAVNLVSAMQLMRAFLAATQAVPLRRVVNISSGAARRPIFGWSAYCSAKAGLDMASRVVALEAQGRGQPVEVVSLAPGVIDTGMQATVRAASADDFADVERFRAMKAQGQLRSATDVAADILRLEGSGRLKGDAVQDLRQIG